MSAVSVTVDARTGVIINQTGSPQIVLSPVGIQGPPGTGGGSGGGIADAPSDGSTYGRKDGAWAGIAPGLPDVVADGARYVRRSGAWVALPDEIRMVKLADEARAQNTSWTVDAELVSPDLKAMTIYRIETLISYTAGTTGDLRYWLDRDGLEDATLTLCQDLDAANAATFGFQGNITAAGNGIDDNRMGITIGYLVTREATGSIKLMWRQSASDVLPTTIKAGSAILLRQMS